MRFHGAGDNFRDVGKEDLFFQEGLDGDFIGPVEHGRHGPADPEGVAGQ